MNALASGTAGRIAENTSEEVNRRIHDETFERAEMLARDPTAVRRRLAELDQEWDVERWVEMISATLTLSGLALGAFVNRRWLLLPFGVQAFFLQHVVQGWCPPVPVLRRMGVRTQREIEAERHAMKAFLGDYKGVSVEDLDDDETEASIEAMERAMQRALAEAMR